MNWKGTVEMIKGTLLPDYIKGAAEAEPLTKEEREILMDFIDFLESLEMELPDEDMPVPTTC